MKASQLRTAGFNLCIYVDILAEGVQIAVPTSVLMQCLLHSCGVQEG